MKLIKEYEQGTPEWLAARLGKITSSKLGDIVSSKTATKTDIMAKLDELGIEYKKADKVGDLRALLPAEAIAEFYRTAEKKLGFYQLIADKMAIEEEPEDPMGRGHRLEKEAVEAAAKKLGKEVEFAGMAVHEEHEDISWSPDGLVAPTDGKYTEAFEVKCLKAAKHLQAYFEQKVPDDYRFQVLQPFIVNPDLEKLYLVFFDPRVTALPLHWLEITREQVQDEADTYFRYQVELLKEAQELLTQLAF